MTSNGFLLNSNRRKIKISVVSSARETDTKRRVFFFFYNRLKHFKNEVIRL